MESNKKKQVMNKNILKRSKRNWKGAKRNMKKINRNCKLTLIGIE